MGLKVGNLMIHFIYGTTTSTFMVNGGQVERNVPSVECVIDDIERDHRVATGKAVLNHKDQYVKVAGRLAAFKKAMSTIHDKQVRQQLWTSFRDNMKTSLKTDLVKRRRHLEASH
jgi:hypothetical protein